MNEDECLRGFGLRPSGGELDQVRDILAGQIALERGSQGDGDTELMKLCCVQLFNAGIVADALLIWQAKQASWDAFHLPMALGFRRPGLLDWQRHEQADGSWR